METHLSSPREERTSVTVDRRAGAPGRCPTTRYAGNRHTDRGQASSDFPPSGRPLSLPPSPKVVGTDFKKYERDRKRPTEWLSFTRPILLPVDDVLGTHPVTSVWS